MSAADGRALQVVRAATIGVALGAIASPPVANLAAALMLAGFFFVPDWRQRLRGFAQSQLGKGVPVFAVALLAASVVAALNPQGFGGGLRELPRWRTLVLLAIAFAVFDSARWKMRFALVFIGFSSLAAIVSLLAWLFDWHYGDLPAGIILRNTVTQAMAFAIGAFLAGMLLVTRPALATRERFLLVAAVLVLLGQLVFLQVGRSGQVMFAILVIVAAALLMRGPRRVLAICSVPVLAAIAFSVSPIMQARFATAWQELQHAADATEYTSMGIRVVMWQNTVELIRARPVLGYGLGGLEPAYAAHIKDRAAGWKAIVTTDPHNQFLAAWVEAGLAGLLAFLFLLVCAARQPAPPTWRPLALSFLVAWCATSMISSHFQTFNEGHLIAILLGVFLSPAGADEPLSQTDASAVATAAATSS